MRVTSDMRCRIAQNSRFAAMLLFCTASGTRWRGGRRDAAYYRQGGGGDRHVFARRPRSSHAVTATVEDKSGQSADYSGVLITQLLDRSVFRSANPRAVNALRNSCWFAPRMVTECCFIWPRPIRYSATARCSFATGRTAGRCDRNGALSKKRRRHVDWLLIEARAMLNLRFPAACRGDTGARAYRMAG